jgi:long-subunit fatty acid transport protein
MLGVRVMLQSWKHEFLVETFGSDDVMLTHLDGIVGLRIPLLPSFQVYLRIPVGLTMTTEPTNMLDVLESRTGADWYLDFGTGWNVGLDLGAMYKVDERFALGVELSWLYVSLSQEGEVSTLYDERLDWERSFSFQQAALGLNLIYTP